MHLQQLKWMQRSQLGMQKGYHLSIQGIERVTFSVKNAIKEGKGLDLDWNFFKNTLPDLILNQ